MNNIKPYTKYKASGIEWLGDIPEHWEEKRLKYLANCFPSNVDKHSREGEQKVRLCNYTDVYKNDFITNEMKFMNATASAEQVTKFTLFKGDVIITKDSETADDIAVPAFVNEDLENVICGYHLSIVRHNDKMLGKYIFRLFQNKKFNTQFEISSNGVTRVGLGVYDLQNAYGVSPPLSEQTAIASFLDYKTAKIDRFIRKKKQLIKLLNEQKAGIINDAVTKGIGALSGAETPNAKMKPSGIEWLGDIPEHWEVRKLKYSVCLNRHKTFENKESVKNKIALENIESKTGRILDSSENAFEGLGTIFRNGDVLFGKLRPYLAKVVSPIFEGSCVNEILVLTPNDKVWDTEFLKFRMLSSEFIRIVNDSTFGSKMPRASWGFIGGLKISCPPLSEQTAIVSHIEKETATINTTIATIEKEIALVQEYRTALIAEAVTGKIDVRGYAFPNVVEEETYEELEEELDIAAEDEAEYQKQETE